MLAVAVKNDKQDLKMTHEAGVLEFGRGPQRPGAARCTIDDAWVSRDHVHVEELSGGRVLVRNLSTRAAIELPDGTNIGVGENKELAMPAKMKVGQTEVSLTVGSGGPVASPLAAPAGSHSATVVPPSAPARPAPPPVSAEDRKRFADEGFGTISQPVKSQRGQLLPMPQASRIGDSPSPEVLTQWMETILALQRAGGQAEDFFEQTAHAMVRMVGLDVGLVILLRDGNWKVVARAAVEEDRGRLSGREFSQTVLKHVLAEGRTFFQDLGQMKTQESLRSVDAVVVSPMFGLNDEIEGVLYGLRQARGRGPGNKITQLEAQLVQLLAAAVGTNLARGEATRTRTQFEQFFSPELVRELERDPTLLDGKRHEVTILMSDLRGFSTLSERLGPEDTCRLVRDVMERQSERIVEHGGTIVSYLGDGILAMWNAPGQQPDHALRACRAALAIQEEIPGLTERWQAQLGSPVSIGVGVNTGPAQVGNTGSTRKFMYGPLGNTVNLASRVEGATKHMHVPILITGATRSQFANEFATRRLCKVRVVGIAEPVDLYELHGHAAAPEWAQRRDAYESGLTQYETKQWFRACQTLLPLLESAEATGLYDFASLKLMKRCWSCLEAPPEPFEPVLDLTSK